MTAPNCTQGIFSTVFSPEFNLLNWIGAFLTDRKAQHVAPGTLKFYQKKCSLFTEFCETQAIGCVTEITPNAIRAFLLHLEDKGHNPGGVHAAYRTLKAFLNWFGQEAEPPGWTNPIHKVKAPRVALPPLKPAEISDLQRLLKTCQLDTRIGARDRAILLFLLDSGVRAGELLGLDRRDLNLASGAALVKQGKGGKPRTVYVGRQTRRAIRAYLKRRQDDHPALWLSAGGERLTYDGLRAVLTRRAGMVGIVPPSLHSFRRAFAINMLRAGVDVFSLQKLMGHADLQVLRRYLAQTTDDIAEAHLLGSPVDNHKL